MLFNSAQFLLLFFPLVTLLYYGLPRRTRWMLLLAASCYFYMVLVPAYILVLGFIISIDYAAGLVIERSQGRWRRAALAASLAGNIGVLAFFKYFDFLNVNVSHVASLIGWNYSARTLGLLLPVGLSFHTFQSMSYTIEVYRGRVPAEHHFGLFALYVMFYPQLVAGPIERPQHLLPQFHREFLGSAWPEGSPGDSSARMSGGLALMAIGLFKKIVIADRLSAIVDTVYDDPTLYHGIPLIVATVAFAIQIYCDFSGYSDMARGAAAVMNIELVPNFNKPYGARSIAEFWHRWHMSLSTWFRDYVYIPLGGNRSSSSRWALNLMLTFLVSGLWHGANWTFVCWGALHGGYMLIGRWTAGARTAIARGIGLTRAPRLHHGLQIAVTFTLTCLAWIFFRARTMADATYIVTHLGAGVPSALSRALVGSGGDGVMAPLGLATLPVSKVEWMLSASLVAGVVGREILGGSQDPGTLPATRVWGRWPAYYALGIVILYLGVYKTAAFIYFQF